MFKNINDFHYELKCFLCKNRKKCVGDSAITVQFGKRLFTVWGDSDLVFVQKI